MHLLSSGTVPEQETKTITPKTMLSISPPPLPPPTSETKKELYQYLLEYIQRQEVIYMLLLNLENHLQWLIN